MVDATDTRESSAAPMRRRQRHAVDLAAEVWRVAECAAFLRQHPDTFRKVTRYKPGFPAPLAHLGENCWAARDVRSWAIPPPIPRTAAKSLKTMGA